MTTYYDVLGVAPGATQAEIRRGYLERAKRHHPDRQSGAGEDVYRRSRLTMQEVNAAWEVLRNPAERDRYDDDLGLNRNPAAKAGGSVTGSATTTTEMRVGRVVNDFNFAGGGGGGGGGDGDGGGGGGVSNATGTRDGNGSWSHDDDHAGTCDCCVTDGCGYVHAPWDVRDGHDRMPPPVDRIDRDPNRVGLRVGMAVIGIVLSVALTTLVIVTVQGRGSGTSASRGSVTTRNAVSGVTPAVGSAVGLDVGSCVVLASMDGRVSPLLAHCSLHGAFKVNEIIPIGRPCGVASEVIDIGAERTRLCLTAP